MNTGEQLHPNLEPGQEAQLPEQKEEYILDPFVFELWFERDYVNAFAASINFLDLNKMISGSEEITPEILKKSIEQAIAAGSLKTFEEQYPPKPGAEQYTERVRIMSRHVRKIELIDRLIATLRSNLDNVILFKQTINGLYHLMRAGGPNPELDYYKGEEFDPAHIEWFPRNEK